MALATLVSGANNEGYFFALDKLTSIFGVMAPVKSALSQYRKRISYLFFEKIYKSMVEKFLPKMETYKGYHIVGFDGDNFDLPPTESILSEGYKGYPVGDDQETHNLKMYVVKCVDLLSNVVLNFGQSTVNDEIGAAIKMLSSLPKKTIAIYDRLYLSKRLINSHMEKGLFFIARCKSATTFNEISEFYHSGKRRFYFFYKGMKINLVKVKNPKGESIVVATNLDISEWTNKEVANLYTLRWDCETNNRDSTATLKVEQWHSKFFNGIMQEIYVHLIMMNFTKMIIFYEGGHKINLENNETKKSNFKFIFSVIFDLIPKIMKRKFKDCIKKIRLYIERTLEKRIRLSRKYPRQVKKKGKYYKNASLVPRREDLN